MEASASLENSAQQSLMQALVNGGEASGSIPVEGTPFVLSQNGEALVIHSFIDHEDTRYYIGVPKQAD